MDVKPAPIEEIKNARVLALLGDSVTTDHISPAGSIRKDGPAGQYLQEHGVKPADFNSYGSRRGNHEVMVRGTFANVRLRNKLVQSEGGFTRHLPTNTEMSIFEASEKYRAEGTPLLIVAGKEYGSGSSRDWAAKVRHCSECELSSPRATSAFTGRIWSAWASSRCNSRRGRMRSR